ncbi:MAG: cobalt ABC transporter [Chlorobiaceae bacterium]|nr:cobalt ABC transporter [Chlorobiaceae bacterium]
MKERRHLPDLETATCSLPVGDSMAIILLAMFVLFVLSVPKYDLAGVIAFAAVPSMLVTAARIPYAPIMKRLLVASPFILFMAAGNLMLDRAPLFRFAGVSVTGGMLSATVIVTKTIVTLSALLSLVTCIPFHRFGIALRSIGVPEVFVTQLLLVYRYSFLLSEEARMMQKARDLRSFGGKGKGAIVTARLIGSLLIRTTSRAERIYMAMCARGFTTLLHSRPAAPMTTRDMVALALSFAALIALRLTF